MCDDHVPIQPPILKKLDELRQMLLAICATAASLIV